MSILVSEELPLVYIRFGNLPLSGKSTIYRNGEIKLGEELGVSCYRGIIIDDKVYIILPHNGASTAEMLVWQYNHHERPLYIVDGDEIGLGTDGEPILDNVKIIKQVIDWLYGD